MAVKAVIFDLDNCLAPPDGAGREFYEPALQAIRDANRGWLGEEALERAIEDCWRFPLDRVAELYGFSDEMLSAAWEASGKIEVSGEISGYPDLHILQEFEVPIFLVTSGFRRLQESKVRALGIGDWFAGIGIDAIDEPGRIGKEGHFRQILEAWKFDPKEVMVVGDSESSEIAAGNRLGIPTVQTLRPGIRRSELAWRHIHSLKELSELIAADKIRDAASD